MKTITHFMLTFAYTCLTVFIFPLGGNTQNLYWPPAQALTDSTFDNLNPAIIQVEYQDLMFWDRYVDSATSEICMQNIYSLPFPAELVVVSQPGVKLTNPILFSTQYITGSSFYYLFYQTNESGGIDIKYIKCFLDGTFSTPNTFSDEPGDDINLHVDDNTGLVSWENGGKIMISLWNSATETFCTPLVADSGGAYSPACSGDGYKITWLKRNGSGSYLKFADLTYGANTIQIQNTDSLEIVGDAEKLTTNSKMFFSTGSSFAFQKRANGSAKWGLCFFNLEQIPPVITEYQSANYNYTSPITWEIMIPVKGMENLHVAFVSDSLGNPEVIATAYMFPSFPEYMENVSNYSGIDQNPSVYFSFHGMYLRTYLLWESLRNGHWTICRTYVDELWGGIEQSTSAENLIIAPNPFKDEVSMIFKSSLPNDRIKIMNMRGQCERILKFQPDANGSAAVIWDGNNKLGRKVPAGTYVILFSSGTGVSGRAIVKSE
jgi:hypothetical protein